MIGTIRKHSALLWWTIIPLVIVSFVWYMGSAPTRSGGHGGSGGNDFGTIYGHAVTQDNYEAARKDFYLYHWLHYGGEWPDKNPNLTKAELEREIFVRLMLARKADSLGIQVSDDAAVAAANEILRSIGRSGQPVPMDTFIKQVLTPEGMTDADFERFVRHDLALQQLIGVMSLPGQLVTPQEATGFYNRENQEISAQAVFFSASNYLSQVTVTPEAVAQFYTNFLAAYRLPDRVQVNYVAFETTNFIAQAKAEWAKTNFEEYVDAAFRQNGLSAFPGAKTEDDAKTQIREALIKRRALADAREQANDFANVLFAMDPPKAENLNVVARQKGIMVHMTAPFAADYGPSEFLAPADFTKAAFQLSSDVPLAEPVAGPDGIYLIALAKQLPSEIPPFDEIRERVAMDFQFRSAALLALNRGTNFVRNLTAQMATGHSFASACVAAGYSPQVLPPFSLSTQELPELGDRAELNQLKQAAFTTPVGHTSEFVQTSDGGFVVYVQSLLPVDEAAQNANMPQFAAQLRRTRANEAFQEWLNIEANRELRSVPVLQPQTAADQTAN
jgi:SurA N-terminal domain/PPIC-type PPIASE domain